MDALRSDYTKIAVIIVPLDLFQLVIIIACGIMHTAKLMFEQCFLYMIWGVINSQ